MNQFYRALGFLAGVIIAILLIGKYQDGNSSRYLIDYVMPYQPFKALLVFVLILLAARLIGGKEKTVLNFFTTCLLSYLVTRGRKS